MHFECESKGTIQPTVQYNHKCKPLVSKLPTKLQVYFWTRWNSERSSMLSKFSKFWQNDWCILYDSKPYNQNKLFIKLLWTFYIIYLRFNKLLLCYILKYSNFVFLYIDSYGVYKICTEEASLWGVRRF